MKKLIFILGICLLCAAIFAAGCLGGNNSSDNSSDNSSSNELPNLDNSSNNTSSSSNNSLNSTPQIAPPIASPKGTAMFFGKVSGIKTVNNTTEIIVRNYGSQMSFVFSDSSRMNFNLSDLKTDQYLKVSFDTPAVVTDLKPVPVVVANLFDGIDYDGWIINITPSSPESFSDIQSIEVASWFGSVVSPMVFHCNETQFFMDLQDIEVGATVSIRGENITSEDMPQAEAYEVYLSHVIFCP
jgi:hypothetical protein